MSRRKKLISQCTRDLQIYARNFIKGEWDCFALNNLSGTIHLEGGMTIVLCRKNNGQEPPANSYKNGKDYVEASIRYVKGDNTPSNTWPIAVEGGALIKDHVREISELLINGYIDILENTPQSPDDGKKDVDNKNVDLHIQVVEYEDFDGNVLRFIGRLQETTASDDVVLKPCFMLPRMELVVIKKLKYRYRRLVLWSGIEYRLFLDAERRYSLKSPTVINICSPYYNMDTYKGYFELRREEEEIKQRQKALENKYKNPRAHFISIPMGGKVK